MGGGQSVRATHFQRPAGGEPKEEDAVEHHISISNKMVERLVEDATLAGGAAAAVANTATAPREDYKEKINMEKLKCLDENHSERMGLTVEDLNATAARIELRTANMGGVDPVCADSKHQVIECYKNESPADVIKCWDTVGAFTKCVQDAASTRLRVRTQKDAREHARRTRHVAHARQHALRDLGPPPTDEAVPT
ncbi:uncharacterized protein LOC113512229 [Galleria mellonella]|uniref:Uncharacterized protein LOC113512229 n=1 Tax=Galleria mellonella TaxID=7137 RepID=A0ABM3MME9_GALME|nr:uncharacterized protein LOC113512229 [Galleria mellonella]